MKQINLNKTLKSIFFTSFLTLTLTAAFTQEWYPDIDPQPVDKEATEVTCRLKKFLCDTYGRHIISGQMDLTWNDRIDMAERVYDSTGKYPAIMGYDFMNYTVQYGDGKHQT